jgi:arginase family enzyme
MTMNRKWVFMEYGHPSQNLALFELVEINPAKDHDEMTARTAVRLIHRLICDPIV